MHILFWKNYDCEFCLNFVKKNIFETIIQRYQSMKYMISRFKSFLLNNAHGINHQIIHLSTFHVVSIIYVFTYCKCRHW